MWEGPHGHAPHEGVVLSGQGLGVLPWRRCAAGLPPRILCMNHELVPVQGFGFEGLRVWDLADFGDWLMFPASVSAASQLNCLNQPSSISYWG